MTNEIDRVRHKLKVAKARVVRTHEVELREEELEKKLEKLQAQQQAAAWGNSTTDLK